MNEDDTFRILARPSIHQMEVLYVEMRRELNRKGESYCSLHNLDFAQSNGWSWEEYLRARKQAGYPP